MNPPFPILEFDDTREAFIEPTQTIKKRDMPEHCVLCFFQDIIEKVVAEQNAKIIADNFWEDGPHPVYEITFSGHRLAFYHPGIGAPLAAALLEEVIAFGCKKFIACGGSGVLDEEIDVGNLIVLSGAIRDEGVSYHYLPPEREIYAHPEGVSALEKVLKQKKLPFRLGKSWTTDAPYRETPIRIDARKKDGCLVVEMEAAGLMAVSEFRGVVFGQLVYGGDDLSGDSWDHREWQSRSDVRESLFWLAAEACLLL